MSLQEVLRINVAPFQSYFNKKINHDSKIKIFKFRMSDLDEILRTYELWRFKNEFAGRWLIKTLMARENRHESINGPKTRNLQNFLKNCSGNISLIIFVNFKI
jgi:hypothetical protein